MRFLLLPFVLLALIGLAVALGANLSALLAHRVLINRATLLILLIGVFVCAIPVILLLSIIHGQRPSLWHNHAVYWKVILSGCPRWLYRLCFGLVIYALVSSLLSILLDPQTREERPSAPRALTLTQARNMSAGPVIFYGIMLPLLLSTFRCPSLLREDG